MSVKDGIILGKRYEVLSKVGAGGWLTSIRAETVC